MAATSISQIILYFCACPLGPSECLQSLTVRQLKMRGRNSKIPVRHAKTIKLNLFCMDKYLHI